MVIGSAHIAFVLAAIIERTQGLVQHNNVDQAQELARSPPSFKSMVPTLDGRRELRGSAVHRLKVPEVGVVNKPDDVTIAARRLQGACSATQPIEIVSTAFPDMEGCYFITSSATDTLYFSTNVASAVGIIESQGRTFWATWFYKDGSPESTPTTVCYSSDDPDEVDATEASAWICDLDLDGTFEAATASEFSIDCGCSSATITDSGDMLPPVFPPSPTPPLGSDSCGDGDAFTIISDEFPETEGCYRDSGRTEEGEVMYTLTGTPFLGQQTVFASVEDDADEAFWVVAFAAQVSSASMTKTYCVSADEASSVHPSDVESWGCVIDSVTTTATDAEFSVVCGCSDSGTTELDTITSATTTTTTSTTTSTTDVTLINNPACSNGIDGVESEDGEVCCVTECGTCGGIGCSSAGGLTGDECCTQRILSVGELCDVAGQAPCIISSDSSTPTCSNGLIGVESEDGDICCVAGCGTCGGMGCGSAGGLTMSECCTQIIFSGGELCDVAEQAPCIISSDTTGTPIMSPTMSIIISSGHISASPTATSNSLPSQPSSSTTLVPTMTASAMGS